MISDADRYYGSVFSRIIDCMPVAVRIEKVIDGAPGFYIVNTRTPLLIKYSTSRFSPWQFNFHEEHQMQQQKLYELYGECVVAFCCGKDGVAAISHKDFRKVLDDNFEEQEAVTLRRRRKEMYRISGRDGVLDRKVSRSSLVEILQTAKQDSVTSS